MFKHRAFLQKESSNLKTEVKMELRELNENDLDSLIKLYEQLDGANGDFTAEDARKNNCYKVILQSASFRKEAHQFYKNLGFDGESKKAFIMKLKDY